MNASLENPGREPFMKRAMKNEVVRFFLSAGVGFLVDTLVYFLVYNYLFNKHGVTIYGHRMKGVTASLVISFSCQVITNFLITKYLVFSESDLKSRKQFFRFSLVAVLGFIANLLLLKLLVGFDVYAPLARILAAVSLGAASYFVHKFFSFKIKKHDD